MMLMDDCPIFALEKLVSNIKTNVNNVRNSSKKLSLVSSKRLSNHEQSDTNSDVPALTSMRTRTIKSSITPTKRNTNSEKDIKIDFDYKVNNEKGVNKIFSVEKRKPEKLVQPSKIPVKKYDLGVEELQKTLDRKQVLNNKIMPVCASYECSPNFRSLKNKILEASKKSNVPKIEESNMKTGDDIEKQYLKTSQIEQFQQLVPKTSEIYNKAKNFHNVYDVYKGVVSEQNDENSEDVDLPMRKILTPIYRKLFGKKNIMTFEKTLSDSVEYHVEETFWKPMFSESFQKEYSTNRCLSLQENGLEFAKKVTGNENSARYSIENKIVPKRMPGRCDPAKLLFVYGNSAISEFASCRLKKRNDFDSTHMDVYEKVEYNEKDEKIQTVRYPDPEISMMGFRSESISDFPRKLHDHQFLEDRSGDQQVPSRGHNIVTCEENELGFEISNPFSKSELHKKESKWKKSEREYIVPTEKHKLFSSTGENIELRFSEGNYNDPLVLIFSDSLPDVGTYEDFVAERNKQRYKMDGTNESESFDLVRLGTYEDFENQLLKHDHKKLRGINYSIFESGNIVNT